MPTGSIGISSSSVVGNTTSFNTEISGDIVSQTTYSKITNLEIETFQTEENKSFFATLQELNFLSASTSESVFSLFKFDSTSGGVLWHKKIGASGGGIISKYFSNFDNERLFVLKSGTGLIALNPDSGAAVHSISVLSPTGGSAGINFINTKGIDSSSVEVYIGGNYTNTSSGQEGFVSKLTYNFSTGFTLNWTIALSGPVTAADEICQVESIDLGTNSLGSHVFCGGYVRTASTTYRPFVIALNQSNGSTAWERVFSTYDNSTPLAINNVLIDTSDLDNPKILCGATLYSTNSTFATPTVFTLLQTTGATSLSRCIAPASGLSGYAGNTVVHPYYGDISLPGRKYFVLSGPSIGTTSSNSTPGFFEFYSNSFGGVSLEILDAYRFTNPEYSPGGPAGIDSGYPTISFEYAKSGSAYLSTGAVYKQLSTPIFGQSSQSVGYIIKNADALPKTYTFRNSGAQAVLQSATVTWQATGSSFTNSAAGSNLNQASVTFSISTITPTITNYTPSNKSFVKTKFLENPGPGPVLG
jgi:hypothetical protein